MGKDLFLYKGMKRILTMITVLTLIQTAAIIMQAEWLSEAVTGLFNGKRITALYPVIGFFLLAFLARHAVTLVRQKIVYQYAAQTGADLRKSFLDQLFRLGPRFVRKEGTGQMVTLAMEGISQFRRYLELFLPKMVSMAVVPAAVVIYVFSRQDVCRYFNPRPADFDHLHDSSRPCGAKESRPAVEIVSDLIQSLC